ncbi:MAG: GNAT family N-acetyltransferase [Candidatus Aureabacteria bacterium]|nr:GNAT family N-acetyltransferase [Candidatus Auribacterota bacterium]
MITIKKAENLREYRELYALRSKAHMQEKENSGSSSLSAEKNEKDSFDSFAVHFVALDPKREVIGTVRLIADADSPQGLPVKYHPGLFSSHFSTLHSAEISQFAADKRIKSENLFLSLFRAVYQYCVKMKIVTVYLNLDEECLNLLKQMGFRITVMGRTERFQYHETLPAKWDMADVESHLRLKNSKIYSWLHQNARFAEGEGDLMTILHPAYSSFFDIHPLSIARG